MGWKGTGEAEDQGKVERRVSVNSEGTVGGGPAARALINLA